MNLNKNELKDCIGDVDLRTVVNQLKNQNIATTEVNEIIEFLDNSESFENNLVKNNKQYTAKEWENYNALFSKHVSNLLIIIDKNY